MLIRNGTQIDADYYFNSDSTSDSSLYYHTESNCDLKCYR